ncbi:hydroxyacid dehydrogenase [Streptomyces sp. SBT349]|uniref:hydroxyacid dehydrogenase n=1 Tax=Streptomyces sp. SBT349 TaxID=1580539 RepID=UPI00069F95B8|nr:hydroxyacid dehydrogenase [Streptomyces sp. SBT349]
MTDRPTILLDLSADLAEGLFDAALRDRLAAVGAVAHTGGSGDPAARRAADILVTGWGTPPLPGRRADAGRLGLVVHSAGTVRRLVPRSLVEDGVRVSHAAAGMARAVAELALWFTLGGLRSLPATDRTMHRDRDWHAAAPSALGATVAGTRVGVVGASRVGRVYIELVRALGATVAVHDPYLPPEEAARLGATPTGLDELLRTCPVVALHAPVTDETRGMIDAARLALVPDGGLLVNTARSALIDTPALVAELRSGRISAALDVFDTEPLPRDDPLWSLPNVTLTPHLGAVTHHSRRTQGTIVVEEVERWVRGAALEHEITAATYDRLA